MKGAAVLALVLLGMPLADTHAEEADMRIQMDVNHLDRLTQANMRVAAKKANVDSDPYKPIFHLMPEAGGCGDPNGPIYAKGKYHMFFQHSPELEWGVPPEKWEGGQPGYSGTGWGHVSSVDGVYWEHEPIALMPERGSYDPNLCASGSAVIADDGTPTIFYTAAEPQTQCIARSQDPNLHWWLKDENNPILVEPDIPNFVKGGFRDPFLWREGATWNMIVCGAVRGVGGMVPHFQSENLTDWTYVGPFAAGMGEHCIAWEVPTFIRFGGMGVLIVSPLFDNLQDTDHAPRGDVSYTIAPYGGNSDIKPGAWKRLDMGSPNHFCATQCMQAPDGRWLLWGMNQGGSSEGHHWSTNLSLPRVITLRPDGLLGQEPPEELQKLRRAHWGAAEQALDGEYRLGIDSNTCEILAEIELGGASIVGLDVRGAGDFSTKSRIAYDVANRKLNLDAHSADFELLPGEDVLRIHAFVDRSVFEVFINRRECGTFRPMYNIEDKAIRLFSEGGAAHIRSVDVWEMGSIWAKEAK